MVGESVLAWVESPLQLVGAAEWAAAHGRTVDLAARVTSQIPETADELLRRGAAFGEKQPYFGIPWRMLATHEHWLVGDGFSGQFRLAAAVLRPRRLTFLDDGLNTLAFADAIAGTRPYRRPGVTERGLTTHIAPLALDHVRRRSLAGSGGLFTAFPLGAAREAAVGEYALRVERHAFEWLRASAPSGTVTTALRGDRVVLGTARSVDGHMRRSEHLAWVAREAAAGPVAYLPHRREPDDLLEAIARIPGVRVVRLNLPVEVALAGLDHPIEVRTLLSSTLTTLPIVLAGSGSTIVQAGDPAPRARLEASS
ncbi:hypothetical protein [Microbacterium sp. Marseille-Q6965]|uniref:hypothetical protein n=1 Tax=Microbacterium sp. Marseille-Q6965 TaxID=2965072 RepID=UPI0021B8074E|nr:hypothetical protein [Microbacterium sp. Marseille-Q6965]